MRCSGVLGSPFPPGSCCAITAKRGLRRPSTGPISPPIGTPRVYPSSTKFGSSHASLAGRPPKKRTIGRVPLVAYVSRQRMADEAQRHGRGALARRREQLLAVQHLEAAQLVVRRAAGIALGAALVLKDLDERLVRRAPRRTGLRERAAVGICRREHRSAAGVGVVRDRQEVAAPAGVQTLVLELRAESFEVRLLVIAR